MFPSGITCIENPTPHFQHHHLPACPLMTYNVIRDSHLQSLHSINDTRVIGSLSWSEDEQIAPFNSRVDFINKTIFFILEKIPLRETPITLVSLCSGGLLVEYFIHQQLKKSGYQDINWRIIDPAYQNSGYANTLKEFKEKVDGNVKAFTTEQVYFNKPSEVADESLASSDKHRGAIIFLSINPPTVPSAENLIHDNSICLRGSAVKDIKEANAIYVMVASHNQKQFVQKAINQMNFEAQVISSEYVIKYHTNSDGFCKVNFCQSDISKFIKNSVQKRLNSFSKSENRIDYNMTLNDISQILDEYISTLPANGDYGIKVFVSDYDDSVSKLKDFFIDSHNKTIFAFFNNH